MKSVKHSVTKSFSECMLRQNMFQSTNLTEDQKAPEGHKDGFLCCSEFYMISGGDLQTEKNVLVSVWFFLACSANLFASTTLFLKTWTAFLLTVDLRTRRSAIVPCSIEIGVWFIVRSLWGSFLYSFPSEWTVTTVEPESVSVKTNERASL